MNKRALLEAAMFVSDSPLTADRLAAIVNEDPENVKAMLDSFKKDLDADNRGIVIEETPEGFEIRVKPEYREEVAKLAPFSDLSDGMLRTLAIIAARQPIKQSLLVKYQGNKVYGYIQDLEGKGLVKTEKFGRTKLITVTSGFESYFGQSTEDIQRMLNKKLEEKPETEEEND